MRSLPSLTSPIAAAPRSLIAELARCGDRSSCADASLWAAVCGLAVVVNAAVCGSPIDCRRPRLARREGGITWIEGEG